MNARIERWHQVSELFDRVADLTPEERRRLLDSECANDPQLRSEVERLLRADEAPNPLDHDIAGQASALLLEGDPREHEGECFGPYRIVKLLGQGGMGRVYLAEREGEDFTQTVALKLVGGYGSFDASLARHRFLDERRILARLQHPHIARLLDGGVGPEAQPWFAMEYVDGAPLTEWCDTHRLGIHERLTMFAKVCDAVDHAHRFLIVHRDIKPGNVLVDERGEPKVLDFGIAKLLEEGDHARTGSTILMTPDYAAPEQMRGGQISTATDTYSMGAVLFEVLTGRKPFSDPLAPRAPPQASRAATEGERTDERAQVRTTTPQALRKRLRGDIDRILRTALDPDPARRYRSAATLAQDLRAVVAGQAISLRSDRAYRVGIFLRRHRLGVAAAGVAVLALLTTTGWALWENQQAGNRAREAAQQADIAKKEALASEKVSELLVSAFTAGDPNERRSLAEPTAKDILDASAANVSKALADTPELRARMQMLLGRTYLNLGYNDQAAEMLEASVAAYLSDGVNLPAQAADAMVVLAIVEGNRQRDERSIELARRVIALKQRAHSPVEEVVGARMTLGMTLISPRHYEEAEQVLASAQPMVVKAYGDPSDKLATLLNNRGYLATVSGNVRESERLLRAALAMRTLKGSAHNVYKTRGLLALALGGQGRFAEAESLLLDNIQQAPLYYAAGSTWLVKALGRLAGVYQQKGDLVRSQSYYQRAIDIETRARELRSDNAAGLVGSLADVLEIRGDTAAAGRKYQLAEEIVKSKLPPTDPARLRATAYREAFLARQDPDGLASNRLGESLTRWIELYGPQRRFVPADLADAMFLDAEHRIAVGRLDKIEAALPQDDPSLEQPMIQARRHYWLARAHRARGEPAAAMGEYRRALEIADRFAGKDSVWGALWRLDYSEALLSEGKPGEALDELKMAEPILKKQMLHGAPTLNRMEKLRRVAKRIG